MWLIPAQTLRHTRHRIEIHHFCLFLLYKEYKFKIREHACFSRKANIYTTRTNTKSSIVHNNLLVQNRRISTCRQATWTCLITAHTDNGKLRCMYRYIINRKTEESNLWKQQQKCTTTLELINVYKPVLNIRVQCVCVHVHTHVRVHDMYMYTTSSIDARRLHHPSSTYWLVQVRTI